MRVIKFRGKATHTNKWLYGDLIKIGNSYHIIGKDDMREDGHHITQNSDTPTWVDEKTIGQFTGLLDKNGKEIYENDIIKIEDEGVVLKPKVVIYAIGMFSDGEWSLSYYGEDIIEVIGNIHDNLELIKEK